MSFSGIGMALAAAMPSTATDVAAR